MKYPFILPLFFFSLALVPTPGSCGQPAKDPGKEISDKYEALAGATKTKSPLVQGIFQNSYICGGMMGKSQIQAAEAKANQQTKEQHDALNKNKGTLDKADASIKEAVDAKLNGKANGKPKVDTTGVDICKGEVDTIKQTFENAKKQAKAAADQKIESIASELVDSNNQLAKLIDGQIKKNDSDRPSDLSGLGKALTISFSDKDKKACTSVINAVQNREADKQMEQYRSELIALNKKISQWKEAKKIETASDIDAQVGKAQDMMLAGKNCAETPLADKSKVEPKKPDSTVSSAKPAEKAADAKPAPAPVAAAKDPAVSEKYQAQAPDTEKPQERAPFDTQAAKPAANAEPAPAAQTEAAPKISKADGTHNTDDVVQGALNDATPVVSAPKAAAASAASEAQAPLASAAVAQAAPAPASPFDKGTSGYKNFNDNPFRPEGANNLSAEGNKQLDAAASSSMKSATAVATAAPAVNPNDPYPVQALDDAPQRGVANYQDAPAYGDDAAGPTAVTKTPEATASATGDKSLTQNLRSSYQSDEIFTKRDLDFNSKKDASIIQRALNQVPSADGRTPTSQLTTDGVMGTRSTARLDEVMQDPVQKAAFLKALRTQMK